MNTTQHTPGPWTFDAIIPPLITTSDRRYRIATVYDHNGPQGGITMKANARLIAAAPDLLAACQSLLHFAELTGWGDLALAGSGNEQRDTISIQTMELARKAIAKATSNEIPTPAVSENLNQPLK